MSLPQTVGFHLIRLSASVSLNPNPGGLPGSSEVQKLLDGGAALGLLVCVGAIVWGAAQWSIGSRSHNYSHASDGKTRMLVGVAGAFGIGAAAALINFFYSAGSAVH